MSPRSVSEDRRVLQPSSGGCRLPASSVSRADFTFSHIQRFLFCIPEGYCPAIRLPAWSFLN